jgi:hypothetical protein
MRIPLVDVQLHRPTRGSVGWYAAIGAMAATGLVEWPLAAIVAAGHLISENSKSPTVSGVAEGAESGAG